MAIPLYLAQTGAEFALCVSYPDKIGWMACHFSAYGTGLSNLPPNLPNHSLIIVNDRTPICGHDPELIAKQLSDLVKIQSPSAILLDFQRPNVSLTQTLTEYLLGQLPCPIAVSEYYAGNLDCPVFLPPLPLNKSLSDHIAPWNGRDIWLEAALDGLCLRLDTHGCVALACSFQPAAMFPHADASLHCHYRIETDGDSACFYLQRTKEDLCKLLDEAESTGITTAVGLYQELGKM